MSLKMYSEFSQIGSLNDDGWIEEPFDATEVKNTTEKILFRHFPIINITVQVGM